MTVINNFNIAVKLNPGIDMDTGRDDFLRKMPQAITQTAAGERYGEFWVTFQDPNVTPVPAVKATAKYTFTSLLSVLVTCTINGVAFSKVSLATGNGTAASVTADINNSQDPMIKGIVKAICVGNEVTIEAITPGAVGNSITVAAAGLGLAVSGSRLTGGTDGVSGETFRNY